jgi:hypothetical protein
MRYLEFLTTDCYFDIQNLHLNSSIYLCERLFVKKIEKRAFPKTRLVLGKPQKIDENAVLASFSLSVREVSDRRSGVACGLLPVGAVRG